MAGFLAAKAQAVVLHSFVDIFVAYVSLDIGNALFVKRLEKTQVRHDSCSDGIFGKLALLLHMAAAQIKDMVAGQYVSVLIDGKAAIGVAVKGKADIKTVFLDEFA